MPSESANGSRLLATRRLQKVGYSTLTMSLPREWVDKNKLNAGDFLTIFEEQNGDLRIEIANRRQQAIRCNQCGNEIPTDSRFCKECGHPLGKGDLEGATNSYTKSADSLTEKNMGATNDELSETAKPERPSQCPLCGAVVTGEDHTCKECGIPLSEQQEAAMSIQDPSSPRRVSPQLVRPQLKPEENEERTTHWISQNPNKRYENGQLSWWAEKAKEGHAIEWEFDAHGYTGRVKLDKTVMTKDEARARLGRES